jgi:hypothetical protein
MGVCMLALGVLSCILKIHHPSIRETAGTSALAIVPAVPFPPADGLRKTFDSRHGHTSRTGQEFAGKPSRNQLARATNEKQNFVVPPQVRAHFSFGFRKFKNM